MEPMLLIAGAGILLGSVLLSTGIERILRRANVRPADPDERSGGFRDALSRIGEWQREQSSRRND